MAEDAWIRICRENLPPLYAFVSRRTGGERQLAEDVVQEAFLRALERFGAGGAPREPLAWLKTVSRNLLADHYRRRRPAAVTPARLDRLLSPNGEDPRAKAAILGWGLAGIRPGQRRLLEAFHLDGRSVRSLAEEIGVTERAVEGRLRRGRRALRKRLAPLVENGGER